METAECHIKDLDGDLEYSIFENLKKNNRVIDPLMSRQGEDNHAVINCKFKGAYHKKLVIDKMAKEFPGKISWR